MLMGEERASTLLEIQEKKQRRSAGKERKITEAEGDGRRDKKRCFVVKSASFLGTADCSWRKDYHDVNERHMAYQSPVEPLQAPFRIFFETLDTSSFSSLDSLVGRKLTRYCNIHVGAGNVFTVVPPASPLSDNASAFRSAVLAQEVDA